MHIFLLQFLRDELNVTDPKSTSSSLLGTYPLKIAFMKRADVDAEARADVDAEDTKAWEFDNVGNQLVTILEDVETKGQDGTLTSFFFKKEPVLLESDKCYVECRRIKQHLVEMNETYIHHGCLHTVALTFYLLCCITLFIRCSLALVQLKVLQPLVRNASDVCNETVTKIGDNLGFYLYWQITLSVVMFLVTFCGIFGILLHRCCWYRHQPLYRMYISILFVYIAFCAISITSLGIGIEMVDRYLHIEGCHSNYPLVVSNLIIATIIASACPVGASLVFWLITLAMMKCRVRKHWFEWVFFDRLWCPCRSECCCNSS